MAEESSEIKRLLRKRNSTLDYSETEDLMMHDCSYIKVTRLTYRRLKQLREALCIQEDEELVIHLLDAYEQ